MLDTAQRTRRAADRNENGHENTGEKEERRREEEGKGGEKKKKKEKKPVEQLFYDPFDF